MKFFLLAALAATAAFARPSGRLAPLIVVPDAEVVPGEYLVMLKDMPAEGVAVVNNVIGSLNVRPEKVMHVYQNGFAAKLDELEVQELRFSSDIDYIEQNSVVHATGVQKNPQNWGLDRISQRDLPLNGQYVYPDSAGEGVDVYVIDTGIYIEHDDFESRAIWGFTANPNYPNRDGNGHGTHVASTIVGKEYGVAKKARVFAVKVLSDGGSGTIADVIAGVEYVTEQAKSGKSKKVVANMSLGGGRSPSLDNAVEKSVASGVTYAVAAGNGSGDACRNSPAGAPSPITVGASTKEDTLAYFSDRGRCVDIIAPGHMITAAWINGKSATRTISGTSMASPHTAGVAALILGEQSKVLSPKEVKNIISEASSQGKLSGLPSDTVNKLLFVDMEDRNVGIDTSKMWGQLVY